MKKIFFIGLLLSLLFPIDSMAQQEHLKFMGIPIDGNVNNFRKKLKGKGLTYDEKVSYSYVYKGNFAGDESTVLVMFDDKTKNVYAVGIVINCSSERIAQDKYWRYVRDITDKYNAIKMKEFLDLYKDTPEKLYPDIINGKFSGFSIVTTDSIENETEIEISKVVFNKTDSIVLNSAFPFRMSGLYFSCSGNVGIIQLKYEKNTITYSNDDAYKLSIIYYDSQNSKALMDKRKEDL